MYGASLHMCAFTGKCEHCLLPSGEWLKMAWLGLADTRKRQAPEGAFRHNLSTAHLPAGGSWIKMLPPGTDIFCLQLGLNSAGFCQAGLPNSQRVRPKKLRKSPAREASTVQVLLLLTAMTDQRAITLAKAERCHKKPHTEHGRQIKKRLAILPDHRRITLGFPSPLPNVTNYI